MPVVSDSFDRANGSLAGSTAQTGQTWSVPVGTFNISTNKAVNSGTSTALIQSGITDLDISCDVTWPSGTGGIVFRSNSDESSRLGIFLDGQTLAYYKKVSGTTTNVGSVARTNVGGTTYRLRAVVVGTLLTAYVNGVQAAQWTIDSTANTATAANTLVGLRGPSTAVFTYNDFVVENITVTGTSGVTLGGTGTVGGIAEVRTATGGVTLAGTAPASFDKIKQLQAVFAQSSSSAVKVAMLGSSTTQGNNASDAAHRYVNLFADAVRGKFGAGGTTAALDGSAAPTGAGFHVRNGGVGATTSATYVNSTRHGYLTTLQPQIVTHMIGANDFRTSVPSATYKANVETVLDAIDTEVSGPVTHVLFNAYQPWDQTGTVPFAEFGTALSQIAAARSNVVYVDLAPSYVARGIPSTDPDNLIDTDNLHQNDAGHAFMAALIFGMLLGFPGNGSLTVSGTAAALASGTRTATGTLTLGGTADGQAAGGAPSRTAQGILTASGTGVATAREIRTTLLLITLAGLAISTGTQARTATGTLTLTGTGTAPTESATYLGAVPVALRLNGALITLA